jgi:hypothetical protein
MPFAVRHHAGENRIRHIGSVKRVLRVYTHRLPHRVVVNEHNYFLSIFKIGSECARIVEMPIGQVTHA